MEANSEGRASQGRVRRRAARTQFGADPALADRSPDHAVRDTRFSTAPGIVQHAFGTEILNKDIFSPGTFEVGVVAGRPLNRTTQERYRRN